MNFVLTKAGASDMLAAYFQRRPLTLRLFVSDRMPSVGDSSHDYAEPSGGGYQPIALSPEAWAVNAGVAEHPPVSFRFSGPLESQAKVFGYMVTNESGAVVYAQRADEPFKPKNPGDNIGIIPRYEID